MNSMLNDFAEAVHRARVRYKDENYYSPNTLRISRQEIEKIKLFGMDVEVVESAVLPDGVAFTVVRDKDKVV